MVVVGAGIGGLVAGALLARAGRRVLVVEQHAIAGGNATIFRRPGYEFDVGLHYVGSCHPDGVIPRILRAAGADDVVFGELDPDGYDILVFPDMRVALPKGIDRFRDRLCEHFPAERAGIDRYVSFLRQMQRVMTAWPQPWRLGAAMLSAPRMWKGPRQTFAELLADTTADPRLRAVLSAQHAGYALPPSRASALVGAGITLHYLEGAYYPRGGGQVLSDRLVDGLRAAGGELRLRTSVQRIVVERGRVAGVELRDAGADSDSVSLVRADTVVSNADLKRTYGELLAPADVGSRTRTRAAEFVMAPAMGVLYLGLADAPGAAAGLPRANYWLVPEDDVEAHYAAVEAGDFHPRPGAFVTLASAKDPEHPDLSPPGVTNVQVMTAAPCASGAWGLADQPPLQGDARARLAYRRAPAYRERKAAFAETLLDVSELLWPDVRERAVFQEVSTPITHTRYTRSSGGTSYGIAATPEQFVLRRPAARTELEGLLLCGASCRAGHGILGAAVSGLLAAAAALPGHLERDVLGGRRAP